MEDGGPYLGYWERSPYNCRGSPYNCRGMETSREGSTTTNTHLTYPTLPTLTPPTLTPTLAPTQLFLFPLYSLTPISTATTAI